MAEIAINAKTRLREDERRRSNPLGTALPWSSTVTLVPVCAMGKTGPLEF